GTGLTVLLEKLVGAAAEEGRSLEECASLARSLTGRGGSMGIGLGAPTVPAGGEPTFVLAEGEMELGVGIHGEPGRARIPSVPAREVAAALVEPVVADLDLRAGDPVVCLVSGLGGTPLME